MIFTMINMDTVEFLTRGDGMMEEFRGISTTFISECNSGSKQYEFKNSRFV